MLNNKKEIVGKISETSVELAEIVNRVIGELGEIASNFGPLRMDRESFEKQIKPKRNLNDDMEESINRIANRLGEINMIPGVPGSCHQLCISKAFGKWNSRKYGFKGIAEKTIAYWDNCSKTNRHTVIFTFAWDELDFNQNYRKIFNTHTADPNKTVCIILVTSQGFSIQYLR